MHTFMPFLTSPATHRRARTSRLRTRPLRCNRRTPALTPVILEQCQLFTKGEIPFAFITWAFVSDAVDARLRSGVPALAPHEWKGGEHAWLIDVISPFEKAEGYVAACCGKFMAGKKVSRLVAGKESVRVEEVVGVAG